MISRRTLVTGGTAAAGLALAGGERLLTAGRSVLDASDALNYRIERLILPEKALVREFDRSQLTKNFPAINTVEPESEAYHRSRATGFADWRMPVAGLVERPMSFSLADLQRFPARTQITQHNCVDGWSAIGEWTGVPMWRLLAYVGLKPSARYIVADCIDGWWDSYDLVDAFHPQTLVAYGMNGGLLPMRHGAPVRLRVERQLGYKSLKFVMGLRAVDRIDKLGRGRGSFAAEYGYQWHAGI